MVAAVTSESISTTPESILRPSPFILTPPKALEVAVGRSAPVRVLDVGVAAEPEVGPA